MRRGLLNAWWIAGLAICATGRAAEPGRTAADDPLAIAKRDYEVLQALKPGAEETRAKLPQGREVTEIDLNPPVPIHARAPSIAERRDGKASVTPDSKNTKNWLIEAVEARRRADEAAKTSGSGTTATSEEGQEPADLLHPSETSLVAIAAEETRATAQKENAVATRREREIVANPLDGYMASWMTTRDFELLQSRSGAAGDGLPPAGVDTAAVGGPGLLPSVTGAQRMTALTPPYEAAPAEMAKNPYLVDVPALNGPAAALPSSPALAAPQLSSPPSVPDAMRAPTAVFAPPEPAAPVKPSEALRNQNDAKYFKQLRRF